MEARTAAELQTKNRLQGRGLHGEAYFNFNKFCEQYFATQCPQQLKREKFVFNFLWTLRHLEEESPLTAVFGKLLRGEYLLRDLHNLLMVKDFVKQHLHKRSNYLFVDLGELGQMFEHSDSFMSLAKLIVLNYDDEFKPFFESKFLQLKGDAEYITVFDFIGLATQAFRCLSEEGIDPILKRGVTSPVKPKSSRTAQGPEGHLLKCYGMTGHLQDRNLSRRDDVKWFLWSDYSKDKRRGTEIEIDRKTVSDFFSVELDDKIRKIKQASAKKAGQRTSSPLPYQNLTERTKGVIDDLDLDIGGRVSANVKKKPTYMGRGVENENESRPGDLYPDQEKIIFDKFDRMPRDMGGGLRDRSIMQTLKDDAKVEARAAEIERQIGGRRGDLMNQTIAYLQECLEVRLTEVVRE